MTQLVINGEYDMTHDELEKYREQIEKETKERLKQLLKITRRSWEGEPGDPDDENNMLSVDDPMRYK